jgi:hypothetical protein
MVTINIEMTAILSMEIEDEYPMPAVLSMAK